MSRPMVSSEALRPLGGAGGRMEIQHRPWHPQPKTPPAPAGHPRLHIWRVCTTLGAGSGQRDFPGLQARQWQHTQGRVTKTPPPHRAEATDPTDPGFSTALRSCFLHLETLHEAACIFLPAYW